MRCVNSFRKKLVNAHQTASATQFVSQSGIKTVKNSTPKSDSMSHIPMTTGIIGEDRHLQVRMWRQVISVSWKCYHRLFKNLLSSTAARRPSQNCHAIHLFYQIHLGRYTRQLQSRPADKQHWTIRGGGGGHWPIARKVSPPGACWTAGTGRPGVGERGGQRAQAGREWGSGVDSGRELESGVDSGREWGSGVDSEHRQAGSGSHSAFTGVWTLWTQLVVSQLSVRPHSALKLIHRRRHRHADSDMRVYLQHATYIGATCLHSHLQRKIPEL